MALRPGEETEVVFIGTWLESPSGVACDAKIDAVFDEPISGDEWPRPLPMFPGRHPSEPVLALSGRAGPDPAKYVTAKVRIAADATPGVYGLRLVCRGGVTNVAYCVVDELPVGFRIDPPPTGAGADEPQSVTIPSAVEGTLLGGTAHRFAIDARRGMPFSVEVFAGRLASELDPVIRVFDPSGRLIAESDTAPGLAVDCRVRVTPESDGPLTVELRDAAYRGGEGFVYHMRLGDFPLVTTTVPLVAKAGTRLTVSAGGEAVEGAQPEHIVGPPAGTETRVAFRFRPNAPAGFARVRGVDLDPRPTRVAAIGGEPPTVALPAVVVGAFARAGEIHEVAFEAQKGQRIGIAPLTKSAGSPAVLSLRVIDSKGDVVADNESLFPDTIPSTPFLHSMEPTLDFVPRSGGSYKLQIEEMTRAAGAAQGFSVRIDPGFADFQVILSRQDVAVAPGGEACIGITTTPQSSLDKIPLTFELVAFDGGPPPTGWELANPTIEVHPVRADHFAFAQSAPAPLRIRVPVDATMNEVHRIALVARTNRNGKEMTVRARAWTPFTLAGLKSSYATLPTIPVEDTEAVTVAVVAEPARFAHLRLLTPAIYRTSGLTTSTFYIEQIPAEHDFRLQKAASVGTVAFEGIPAGYSAKLVRAGERQKDFPVPHGRVIYECELTGPADDSPGGEQSLTAVITHDVHDRLMTTRLEKIPIRTIGPLAIDPLDVPAVRRGRGLSGLRMEITRFGTQADRRPVEVTFDNLPAGMSAATVIAGPLQPEVETPILVAPTVPPGRYDGVVARATTVVEGRQVSAVSGPFSIEVR